MKQHGKSLVRRLLKGEHGQTLVVVALGMFAFVGATGTAIDLGHGYAAKHEFQASANEAALAAAEVLPNTTTAASNAQTYSAAGKNASVLLEDVKETATPLCLSTVTTTLGVPCVTSTGSTSGAYNAIRVVQTAKLQLWFGSLFGVPSINISATATAAMSGGVNTPWNIAIVLDTTESMSTKDSGTQCDGTQISCALLGVQSLLSDLQPCVSGAACTSTNAVDNVSLFVFPAATAATAPDDTECPSKSPTSVAYTFPDVTAGSSQNLSLPTSDTYEVITNSDNYQSTSDGTTTLDTSSPIVIAAGGSGSSKTCPGITAPGGEGTYYAQVIYAAQAALVADQKTNSSSQNAMIILSDGDATASSSQMKATTGTLNGSGTKTSNPSYYSYTYPSLFGQCGQAIVAAMAATAAGTRVYTIGYGAETSGCTSDATYSAYKGVTPCQALQDMASNSGYFYSDDGDGCASPNEADITELTQIFQHIHSNLTQARLIPNSTT